MPTTNWSTISIYVEDSQYLLFWADHGFRYLICILIWVESKSSEHEIFELFLMRQVESALRNNTSCSCYGNETELSEDVQSVKCLSVYFLVLFSWATAGLCVTYTESLDHWRPLCLYGAVDGCARGSYLFGSILDISRLQHRFSTDDNESYVCICWCVETGDEVCMYSMCVLFKNVW